MDPTSLLAFLNSLSLSQFLLVVIVVSLVDFGVAVGKALNAHTFALNQVADFLSAHILSRVLPLFALAYVGHGNLPLLDQNAVAAAATAAGVGLAAYVAETYGSLRDTLATKPAPAPAPATP